MSTLAGRLRYALECMHAGRNDEAMHLIEFSIESLMGEPTIAGEIFGRGLVILKAAGVNDRSARSLLGKWRKKAGDDKVLKAIEQCEIRAVSDPSAYITAYLDETRTPEWTKPKDNWSGVEV